MRIEAEAVKLIIERCVHGTWRHLSSEMARIEIDANPDSDKRRKVRALLPALADIITNSNAICERAKELEAEGFGAADAVHLAAAEAQSADVFLTCDDRLMKRAQRAGLRLRVENPVDWLRDHEYA
ncbi:MAG: PIN domain-containing protein [Rhodospirillales bacterium]|nr:PIN domain-containing protein [Rhodospirillales bacterium]